jgi:hypothetical protein
MSKQRDSATKGGQAMSVGELAPPSSSNSPASGGGGTAVAEAPRQPTSVQQPQNAQMSQNGNAVTSNLRPNDRPFDEDFDTAGTRMPAVTSLPWTPAVIDAEVAKAKAELQQLRQSEEIVRLKLNSMLAAQTVMQGKTPEGFDFGGSEDEQEQPRRRKKMGRPRGRRTAQRDEPEAAPKGRGRGKHGRRRQRGQGGTAALRAVLSKKPRTIGELVALAEQRGYEGLAGSDLQNGMAGLLKARFAKKILTGKVGTRNRYAYSLANS